MNQSRHFYDEITELMESARRKRRPQAAKEELIIVSA